MAASAPLDLLNRVWMERLDIPWNVFFFLLIDSLFRGKKVYTRCTCVPNIGERICCYSIRVDHSTSYSQLGIFSISEIEKYEFITVKKPKKNPTLKW